MPSDSHTTRTFVCAGCGKAHAILYGARVKCSCGTTSAVEVQQPSQQTQTTKIRLPDPADYPTYGAWFRALDYADYLIKQEAWAEHDAAQKVKETP